jgi:hypothetical protein
MITLSPELRELLRRAAMHPHGLGFVHQASLETVAVTLRVGAAAAIEARSLLESAEGRTALIDEFRKAREELRAELAAGLPPAGGFAPTDPAGSIGVPPRTEEELIEAVRAHPLGEAFLRDGGFETVAITFGVHAALVLRARDLLPPSPEPGSGQEEGD